MIWPTNLVTCALFNTLHSQVYSGVGTCGGIVSRVATSWWASANVAAGFVFFFWFLTPVLYYTNTWYAKYMPPSSRTSFERNGNSYDVSQILTPESTLDAAKYEAYSPLFLSTTFALSYGLSFARDGPRPECAL